MAKKKKKEMRSFYFSSLVSSILCMLHGCLFFCTMRFLFPVLQTCAYDRRKLSCTKTSGKQCASEKHLQENTCAHLHLRHERTHYEQLLPPRRQTLLRDSKES